MCVFATLYEHDAHTRDALAPLIKGPYTSKRDVFTTTRRIHNNKHFHIHQTYSYTSTEEAGNHSKGGARKRCICSSQKICNPLKMTCSHTSVGAGNHSEGGRAKIKPEVKRWLQEHGVRFGVQNNGCFWVDLGSFKS